MWNKCIKCVFYVRKKSKNHKKIWIYCLFNASLCNLLSLFPLTFIRIFTNLSLRIAAFNYISHSDRLAISLYFSKSAVQWLYDKTKKILCFCQTTSYKRCLCRYAQKSISRSTITSIVDRRTKVSWVCCRNVANWAIFWVWSVIKSNRHTETTQSRAWMKNVIAMALAIKIHKT